MLGTKMLRQWLSFISKRKAQLDSTSLGAPAALIEAAKGGHEAVVEVLLEEGATIETMDASGDTALVHSVRCNHEAVVALLLQIGANAEAEDKHGVACLMIAVKNCNKAIMDLLIQHGAKKSWSYYRARIFSLPTSFSIAYLLYGMRVRVSNVKA